VNFTDPDPLQAVIKY